MPRFRIKGEQDKVVTVASQSSTRQEKRFGPSLGRHTGGVAYIKASDVTGAGTATVKFYSAVDRDLEDKYWVELGGSATFTGPGTKKATIEDHADLVLWEVSGVSGTITLSVDYYMMEE